MRLFLVLSLSLIWAGNLWGQQDQSAPRVYETHHVNPHSPEVDGKLDDPAWESVPWSENFTQGSPNSGEAPSQDTQFKVLYDDKNIYFGIRAFDTDPELIVNRVARRDDFDADWVEVNIDSYYDKRTAFSFTLSPAAVRGDELISNDGNDWDSSWDPVWYGATSVDEKGWIAEMRIPLSQLRFAAGDNQTWGLQVNRQLYRKDERSNWRFIPNNSPGWVSQFGQLKGITGIKPSRRMEVLPYVVGDISRFRPEANNPFRTGQIINSRLGLDTKFG
ncbi:MAG: carbohydrate binding family 9 domain-containing protein [Candidatus Latescibacteria bacterium]|nr:carbohydrate binding family 9 domain-containing protein [Candidatus Latescibacterota bacterium]